MTGYLSQETIKGAVDRLGTSRAQSALCDFLVFKRALIRANEVSDRTEVSATIKGSSVRGPAVTAVVTGTRAEHYVAAIADLAGVADPDASERPFFSPFGARRDKGRGYRSKKYPSNGPSDTVTRWGTRPARPLELVPDTSPKEFALIERSPAELQDFFLIEGSNSGSSGEKPRLIDLAIWLHRAMPVPELAGDDASPLIELVTESLGLSEAEIDGLFSNDTDSVHIAQHDSPADSTFYLPVPPTQPRKSAAPSQAAVPGGLGESDLEGVIGFVAAKGFVFEPWQVAAFVTACRTKPFVILAGISGTGKTKLPRLVAEATGSHLRRIVVRPDWTDSSELLGYERLDGQFVPGELLRIAREAMEHPDQQFFALLDEMNVARVEYYLAEVLSHIEERVTMPDGTLGTAPLAPAASDSDWASVHLPGNLCIVGSVNMDETTFGFSRKVLDRSFVIEFSSISLSTVRSVVETQEAEAWSVDQWRPQALALGEHPLRDHEDVGRVVAALETINQALVPIQLQVGYRVRDEVAMFVLGAHDCSESFVGDDESVINALDLAIAMKVLPRIQGSGVLIQTALERLLVWADPGAAEESTTGLSTESFPFCADRIAMMLQRLADTGFTSFWL